MTKSWNRPQWNLDRRRQSDSIYTGQQGNTPRSQWASNYLSSFPLTPPVFLVWDGRRLSPNHLKPLSIISVRSAARHSRLRKIWNKAFAPGPVRDYGELLVGRANQLIEMLKATCQRSPQGICRVNFSKLFNQLTWVTSRKMILLFTSSLGLTSWVIWRMHSLCNYILK